MEIEESTQSVESIEDELAEVKKELRQYLTFVLGGEEYGFDILRVQEIRGWDSPTVIPNTPEYIKGVLNLRGSIVPVVDLRQLFRLESVNYDDSTVVIVVHIKVGDDDSEETKDKVMGMVVDGVSDVFDVDVEAIRPAPDFNGVVSSDFVVGLATAVEKMVVLIDIDHLVNHGVMRDISTNKRRLS
ncbi:MAG: chemotaxis protein CheW [Thiotrichales bacterium]|jgi:purine-binding chemotaxis protein CheW|nr:chemotaxis protein CheW [Thiotrichales bacterium]MBT3614067.1 chemotaxis protein CheW [Thiotrichales bacterium]MBT4260874.1 chemotaxis protein CheW [Thiotrichales bacterium]MBT5290532.1 chemotaxis protein CheW [Thiotrichales bacterium]MBT5417823.1 chemotaxis protein CheW [Thiotrichales bacterium]